MSEIKNKLLDELEYEVARCSIYDRARFNYLFKTLLFFLKDAGEFYYSGFYKGHIPVDSLVSWFSDRNPPATAHSDLLLGESNVRVIDLHAGLSSARGVGVCFYHACQHAGYSLLLKDFNNMFKSFQYVALCRAYFAKDKVVHNVDNVEFFLPVARTEGYENCLRTEFNDAFDAALNEMLTAIKKRYL